jgi:hypothetical protein
LMLIVVALIRFNFVYVCKQGRFMRGDRKYDP